MPDDITPHLVATTLANLKELERRLRHDRDEIDRKMDEVRANINQLTAQAATGSTQKPRRKRGQNLEDIREELRGKPAGLTAAELANRVGIPPSSAQNVLRKNPREFVQGADGLWRRVDEEGGRQE